MVQVFQNGLRLLDGAKMTQELLLVSPQPENAAAEVASNPVVEATIADPFVLLKMSDGNLQLVVGGKYAVAFHILKSSRFFTFISSISFHFSSIVAYNFCFLDYAENEKLDFEYIVSTDPESTKLSISQPPSFVSTTDAITACTLYQDKGPHHWLQRTCSESIPDRSQWPSASDQVCFVNG